MKAPIIFTSASHSINIQKMFKVRLALVPRMIHKLGLRSALSTAKVILSKVFELKCTIEPIDKLGEPLLIF
jgi:Gtp-binding protein of the ras superfamily involved in termination of M-phase